MAAETAEYRSLVASLLHELLVARTVTPLLRFAASLKIVLAGMATPEVFDVESLIAPINDDQPVGEDLRADASPNSLYYQIKDARTQARAAERQAQMTGDEDAVADWSPILAMAPTAIQSRSKDLEIAAYYIESLARMAGFPGLRDGFKLVRRLVEEYGEKLYPEQDEDGLETTVAPLTGLNGEGSDGTLIGPIGAIPLTDQTSHGAFSQLDYRQAEELERMAPDAQQRRLDQGGINMSTFQMAVNESSAEFYVNLREDIEATIEAFAELTQVLDDKFGQFSPPASAIRQALEASRDTVDSVARDKLATAAPEEEADAEEEDEGDDGGGGGGGKSGGGKGQPVGRIENRDDAFREILKISEYFRRTEPHSPISYALEQIVRWGRLPLPDLLKEVIDDESSISQMFRLVGIRKESDSE